MKSLAGAFFAAVNLLYAAVFGGPIGGEVAIAGEVARDGRTLRYKFSGARKNG